MARGGRCAARVSEHLPRGATPLGRAGRETEWDGMGRDGMGGDGGWEMVVYCDPSCYTHALTYLYVMDVFRAFT